MIIKRKSLIVGLVSSFVIALVLVLTLIGYYVYLEFKSKEFERHYQDMLEKAKARVYAKYIDITDLDARIENSGVLKGKAIVEGRIRNRGAKTISNLALRIDFLDRDNTIIYESIIHPLEPALSNSSIAQVSIPYIYTPPKVSLKADGALTFKKVITNCPTEVFVELREGERPKKSPDKWSSKVTAETISLNF